MSRSSARPAIRASAPKPIAMLRLAPIRTPDEPPVVGSAYVDRTMDRNESPYQALHGGPGRPLRPFGAAPESAGRRQQRGEPAGPGRSPAGPVDSGGQFPRL